MYLLLPMAMPGPEGPLLGQHALFVFTLVIAKNNFLLKNILSILKWTPYIAKKYFFIAHF